MVECVVAVDVKFHRFVTRVLLIVWHVNFDVYACLTGVIVVLKPIDFLGQRQNGCRRHGLITFGQIKDAGARPIML